RACASVSFVTDSPLFTDPRLTGGIDRRWDNYMGTMRLGYKRTSKSFLDFMNGTQKGLELENWSYIPVNFVQKAFDDLRAKNIPVHVITNADMDGPGIIKHAEEYANNTMVARHNRGSQTIIQLSPLGAMEDAHSLTPAGSTFRIHSKVGLRDGKDILVGSFNIDPRSYSTNLESAVEVMGCPSLAKDLRGGFDYLRSTYVSDVKSGRVPPREPPSFFAKIIGIIGINFL
ncbi:MAG: phosphatidylserine/phosphatidylglycerophosphate/cardiolipin synthase family protein, partial [Proteobacteria bacterium]